MNRQQMMAILSSMSDEGLMKAMNANGIPVEAEEGLDLGLEDAGLEPWAARDVSVGESERPQLFDKSALVKPKIPQMRESSMYMPKGEEDPSMAPYMVNS